MNLSIRKIKKKDLLLVYKWSNDNLVRKNSINKKKNIIKLRSIRVEHGNIDSTCYVINDKCAYAPDVSKILPKDLKYLKKLDYLVIDCFSQLNPDDYGRVWND